MKAREVKELVGLSRPSRPRRARAQAGLGWRGSGPYLEDTPAPPAPVPPEGDTQALLDEGPTPAVDAAGGVLGQAGDAFLPGHGSLSSIQPFTCLGEAYPHRRQGVMGAGEEASAS